MPLLIFADVPPSLLAAVAAVVLVALGLIVAGAVSARRAARLPSAKSPPAAVTKAFEPPPGHLPEQPKPAPPAVLVELREPEVPLTAAQALAHKEAQEAEKKEAYRQRKALEAAERELKREAEEAARLATIEADRLSMAAAELQAAAAQADLARKVQAEAGKTLADGLAKTRGGFMSRLNGLFGGPRLMEGQLLGELEEVLFSADIGVKTASQLLEVARQNLKRSDLTDPLAVKRAIRKEIERIIDLAQTPVAVPAHPQVWMIVGVNGAGKTTTIGKLAAQLTSEGNKVVLGAADTFRAAATEQLAVWAERAGAELVRGTEGADPGSVAFEAVKRAKEIGAHHVLVDTAGRLHTKAPLMEELKKVKRVIQKAEAGAPHEILLVLDATNGQNAIAQARQFHESLQVTAIALTKLDGTAKGGVLIGICDELKIPLRYVGVGEAVGDLQNFEAQAFVEALFA